MKKFILFILLLTSTTMLFGCDKDKETTTLDCIDGYEQVGDKCVEKVIDKVIPVSDLSKGPAYTSQGYETYAGRSLVSDGCSHLENIGQWQPVWCDEFNYKGLPDPKLWGYDVGGHGWGNNELQYYTDADIDNAYVDNGYLTIKAIEESFSNKKYTSTRLISKNKGDWTYGKIQIRAKMPSGRGTWPAAWMLPTDWEYGGWPHSGEIDIMEYVGYDPNVLHGTIHTGAYNHSLNTQVGKSVALPNAESTFNVFEIEWEPNKIRYYLNGIQYYDVSYDPDVSTNLQGHEAWPFDKDFHLILNLAIGGNWGGANGVAKDICPTTYEIDYVRVYQKDYAKMDKSAPEDVKNIRVTNSSHLQTSVGWDIAKDDVMTKHYEVYLDDVKLIDSTHTGILLDELKSSTKYNLSVIAVDFANNKSQPSTISFTTADVPTANEKIEAENYTSMSGIQIESTTDVGGGKNISYIDENDYLTYTIKVDEQGTYILDSRIASNLTGGNFDLFMNNTKLISTSFASTGDWQNWKTVSSESFTLPAGTHTFKILATSGGWNLNHFTFRKI